MASADFEHVLLTRFSAVFRAGDVPAQPEWLRYRLGFFVDACWSSVRGQRGADDFTWYVLLDDRCPDDFRADIESLAEDTFVPLWTHEAFSPAIFARAIDGGVRPSGYAASPDPAAYVLTTRLDSDDGIARDFMASVQREFREHGVGKGRLFIDFPRGIQVDRGGGTYLYDQLSSPFLTLVEPREPGVPLLTVYSARHARARESAPLREVMAPPMWLQVIHGSNLLNITVGARVSPRVVEDRFELELGYRHDVRGLRLLGEKARHRLRLLRLWTKHPGELTKWAEARYWRLRGTHVRPQGWSPSLTEGLKARAARLGWRR